jgi:hypothetical protein
MGFGFVPALVTPAGMVGNSMGDLLPLALVREFLIFYQPYRPILIGSDIA